MSHVRVEGDFEAIAAFVTDGLALLTPGGIVAGWSAAAAEVTGIGRLDAMGRSLDELFARIDPPLGFALVPEDLLIVTNDESRRTLHASALTIDDGWLISFGRQNTYGAIEQLKNEIVTAVSHELKTPIATIKAFSQTMRANPDATSVDRAEFLTTIEEQADHLARVVDDLLAAGRVDAEHLLNERALVPLREIVADVKEYLGPTQAARVESDVDGIEVSCDRQLLSHALAHLVENGLKYSADSAPVTIRAEGHDDETKIFVEDRGIGIGADHLPYIFERFYRVESHLVSATGGTGLGLYIAQSVARAHGGGIDVDSKLHAGTTMTMRLPKRDATR